VLWLIILRVANAPPWHSRYKRERVELRLSMVKANTVKDGVLFAVPDVPSEHQEQQGLIFSKNFKIE
jgi:hypothetical protein